MRAIGCTHSDASMDRIDGAKLKLETGHAWEALLIVCIISICSDTGHGSVALSVPLSDKPRSRPKHLMYNTSI